MFITNSNRLLVFNADIVEWDIKSANLSIIKEYGLLSDKKIEKLESMDKQKRVISVGYEMGKDTSFSKELESKFNSVMQEFININNLDIDYDILSIKRDAAFVVNKEIKYQKLFNHIQFISKSRYHAYMFIKPYEFYFSKNGIEVKGLNNDLYELHKDGILSFLIDLIELLENNNRVRLHSYLSEFVLCYKNKELPFSFYREFNNSSNFLYSNMGQQMKTDNIDESIIENIDIIYNYMNIIIPAIQLIS